MIVRIALYLVAKCLLELFYYISFINVWYNFIIIDRLAKCLLEVHSNLVAKCDLGLSGHVREVGVIVPRLQTFVKPQRKWSLACDCFRK